MATTNSLTTTYAGEFAGQYISAALLSGNTLSQGGLTVKPNIAFKEVMKKISTDDILKDATCDFDPTSTVTTVERILQPEEFQVNLQLCKKDFITDWEAGQMGLSAYKNMPPKFTDFLIGHVAEKVAQRMETNIWAGTNATSGQFDGLTTIMEAATGDDAVLDVTGTTVTAANVIDELGKVVDAIPNTVKGEEDVNIYVPSNVFYAYVRALGGFGAQGLGANGVDGKGNLWYNNGELKFDGLSLFKANGLSSNVMVAAQKSNLFFGTGLLRDQNEVKVIDMADIDGSQNIRVIMRMTAGVQYGIGSEIVLYN
tara:strand:+ start:162 stop:1097 length:936 start_codon:yes stop_codon:yes gene_type:complete